jgi:hypothetical protein
LFAAIAHSRLWQIVLQKSFCTGDQKFCGLQARFSSKHVGTSSHGDELTGNLANELDAISIDDRGLFRLLAGKLSHGNLGLLQTKSARSGLGGRLCSARRSTSSTPLAYHAGEPLHIVDAHVVFGSRTAPRARTCL